MADTGTMAACVSGGESVGLGAVLLESGWSTFLVGTFSCGPIDFLLVSCTPYTLLHLNESTLRCDYQASLLSDG